MPEWSEASLAFLISMALEFGKKMLVALLLFWIDPICDEVLQPDF